MNSRMHLSIACVNTSRFMHARMRAALNALKEEAESSAPALGYSVPYAFGNVLLTIWGTVIINVMS